MRATIVTLCDYCGEINIIIDEKLMICKTCLESKKN